MGRPVSINKCMIPSEIKSLILDMDGVLWRADSPIGDLPAIFDRIKQKGIKVAFATNNGTRTPEQITGRLSKYGVNVDPWQVVTSAMGVVDLLRQKFPSGGLVFAVGEDGIMAALSENGFSVLNEENAFKADAVVMSFDRQVTFSKISEAALLVRKGVPFYATNPDKTFPTPRGEIPGAGAWISVITTSTGVEPIYAGKPLPYLFELARQRLGTKNNQTLVVGDRLETDIAGGQAAGCPVALVLSGVSTRRDGETWQPRVDLIVESLADLVE
jgi:4-nitrophenyl phosphatase